MKKEVIANDAQSAKGLLSQALISNGMVYTAGFIHLSPDGELVGETTEEKLHQVMQNIEHTLKAAGSELNKVIKATIYVTDMSIVPELNTYYVEYFDDPMPVREAVQVSALPLGADIEISVIAEL